MLHDAGNQWVETSHWSGFPTARVSQQKILEKQQVKNTPASVLLAYNPERNSSSEVYSRSNQTGNKLTNPQVNNQMHIPRPPVRALPTSTRVSKSASSGNIGRLHCRTAKRRSSSSLVRLAIVSLPATLQLVLPAWCPILQQSNKGTGFFHQFDDIGV